MRTMRWMLCLLTLGIAWATPSSARDLPLKVAIYVDEGSSSVGFDNIQAILSDPDQFEITPVLGADIRAGVLQGFDVIIHPGGSGSGQATSLEEAGRDSVRAFVERGGGFLGICAGSYLVSSDYTWSLNLLNARVIDKAHWARGTGPTDIRFNRFGRELFALEQDTVSIEYRQGPLLGPKGLPELPGYIEAGVYESEIAENGAPPGVMIGTTAFAFSVYGEGRVAAFSPHPERTDVCPGFDYMVADAVLWSASEEPFLAFVTPRELKGWEAGSTQTVEWIGEDLLEPVLLEFSPDNGATWQPVVSGQAGPYEWTVPVVDSQECLLRVESLLQPSLADTVVFAINPPPPTMVSLTSGDWHDPFVWDGNVVPDSLNNVTIGAGHTITVDATASCRDLSFADDLGRLAMQADLRLFGDFHRFDAGTNHFYSGSSLWEPGARLVFCGDAETQTIHNLGTTSTSPYPGRFDEVVVNKSYGAFTIGGDSYILGIGNSLEIIQGTFDLGVSAKIEGRTAAGTASTPTITVHPDGVFRMLGYFSHIRRGNFIGADSSKIGKMTVWGTAYLANTSSNRVNIGGIDVEDGGLLRIPWYSEGGSMGAGRFNPGTVTIKSGGTFHNSLNTDIWYDNTTTPNQIALLAGGLIEHTSSTPVMPGFAVNEGTVLYSRGSSDQTVFDMDYHHLEFRNSTAGARKLWNLAADRTVSGELTNAYSAESVLTADVACDLTIAGTLRLTSGQMDNSDADVTVVMADGAQISRATGLIAVTPSLAGGVGVRYWSTNHDVTTGAELPDAVTELAVDCGEMSVTLGKDVLVEQTLTLSSGVLANQGRVLALADGAAIRRATGSLGAAPTFGTAVDVDYISVLGHVDSGHEIPVAGGVLRDLALSGSQGVTLTADAIVNGLADIQGSDLATAAQTVSLAPTAVLQEGAHRIVGAVTSERTLQPGVNETFGGIGLELLAAAPDPAAVSVLRRNDLPPEHPGIGRTFAVQGAARASFLSTLRFKYHPSEVGAADESLLALFRSDDGGLTWQLQPATVDTALNVAEAVDVDPFALWTLAEDDASTGVDDAAQVPRVFDLQSCYPNPFNPATTIAFTVAEKGPTTLTVYDLKGARVARLFEETALPGTRYTVRFDGTGLASGMYFGLLRQGGRSDVMKMVLVK